MVKINCNDTLNTGYFQKSNKHKISYVHWFEVANNLLKYFNFLCIWMFLSNHVVWFFFFFFKMPNKKMRCRALYAKLKSIFTVCMLRYIIYGNRWVHWSSWKWKDLFALQFVEGYFMFYGSLNVDLRDILSKKMSKILIWIMKEKKQHLWRDIFNV